MSLRAGKCSFVTQEDGRVLVTELEIGVRLLGEEKSIILRLDQEVSAGESWVWKDIAPGTKGRISKLKVPVTADDRFIQAVFEGQKLPRSFHYQELDCGDLSLRKETHHQKTFDGEADGSAHDIEAPVFNPFT